jgi:hypothetical protein
MAGVIAAAVGKGREKSRSFLFLGVDKRQLLW